MTKPPARRAADRPEGEDWREEAYWKFTLDFMVSAMERFHVVACLADLLDARHGEDPGDNHLPTAMVRACADLREQLDRLENDVLPLMKELDELRQARPAA